MERTVFVRQHGEDASPLVAAVAEALGIERADGEGPLDWAAVRAEAFARGGMVAVAEVAEEFRAHGWRF